MNVVPIQLNITTIHVKGKGEVEMEKLTKEAELLFKEIEEDTLNHTKDVFKYEFKNIRDIIDQLRNRRSMEISPLDFVGDLQGQLGLIVTNTFSADELLCAIAGYPWRNSLEDKARCIIKFKDFHTRLNVLISSNNIFKD